MYQYLTGKVVEKTSTSCVVDVAGIGYLIQISASTYKSLPEVGQSVRVLTHFVVREDAQILYGFASEEERHLFRLLISVSGIGPKMAITILSGFPIAELKRAIIEGSLPVLTAIPGIGRKSAERVVVELRERLVLDERRTEIPATVRIHVQEELIEDSLQALMSLGYPRRVAKDAVQKALRHSGAEKISVEEIVRFSLKYV